MHCSKWVAGSSRSLMHASLYSAAFTSTVSSPARSVGARPRFFKASRSRCRFGVMESPRNRVCALDLVLQLHQAVEQRLGGRRTARHVNVDRNDAVAPAHD